MIVEFTVGNFLSFNEKRTLSFEARGGVSELKDSFFMFERQKFLRSVVLYGANSSGKSNLIKALDKMRESVLLSVRLNDTDKLSFNPFLLSSETKDKPTFFEIIFISENQTFRYGFEYNLYKIISEWLFIVKNSGAEEPLFVRTQEGIAIADKFLEGKGKEESTNDNRLFISLVAQLGGKVSKQILQWFYDCNILSGIKHYDYESYTLSMFDGNTNGSSDALQLFQDLQLGFNNVEVIVSEDKEFSLNTIHNKYDKNGKIVGQISWNKDENESEGTKKLIDFSGPIFDTLKNGKILIIDELDSKLHPLITMQIIKLFNNPETNQNNAQLLFATHDTNLLSTDIFRRDQVWFTEKDELEQTDLYALDDFVFADGTKVRKDANLEKNYIAGRYGAIPYITNL
jgi:AAA15 family ATPase/GTPase